MENWLIFLGIWEEAELFLGIWGAKHYLQVDGEINALFSWIKGAQTPLLGGLIECVYFNLDNE